MARVRPTAASGMARRTTSAARRWASASTPCARRRRSGSRSPGGNKPGQVAHGGHDVRFVDGAHPAHLIRQRVGRDGGEAGEALCRSRIGPPSPGCHPTRRGEVVQGHHRFQPAFPARPDHPSVVPQRRPGELPLLGFDAAPLQRESVGVEPEGSQQVEILGIAVVVVAGIAAGLDAERGGVVLPRPPVVVPVPPFDLVSRSGRAPQEPAREEAHRRYRPLNRGGRFSRKAVTPSITSSEDRHCA